MGGNPAQSKVKVIVRVRPLLESEPNTPCACVVDVKHVRVLVPGRAQSYSFKYDSCYDIDSMQESIFEREVQPRVSSVFEGVNTTVFAYGNTGAGKTFTMQGNEEKPGIIPRVAESMINFLATFPQKATLHMSYVELYNERLYDLLLPRGNDLAIREDKAKNIIIPELTEIQIKSLASFKQLFETGCKHRSTGATKLNPNSSRSHAILMFKVQVQQASTILTGKFNLIDLAGSEDNRKTGNKGIRLTESSNINQSLFVLGNVVNSLNSGSLRVPYRDSKLTRILQDSLGGSSYAVMIANIAPTAAYYGDTLNTLNFALKSRNITNKPTVHSMDIAVPAPIQVVADCNATENRKNQLEAWKKGKNHSSNKENQENNSALLSQMEKLQQELTQVKNEVQKGKLDASDFISGFENKMQQFLGNQMTLMHLQKMLRDPVSQLSNAPLVELPKNLGAMTPCSKITKIKQLIEEAAALTREYHYPQAIQVYSFILPFLGEDHKKMALHRIAFLNECQCMSKTPGSLIHRGKLDDMFGDENTTFTSNNSMSDDENEDYASDEETTSRFKNRSVEPTPYKAFPAPLPPSMPPSLPSSVSSSQAPKTSKPKPSVFPASISPASISSLCISPVSLPPSHATKQDKRTSPPSPPRSPAHRSDEEMQDSSEDKKHKKVKKEKIHKQDKTLEYTDEEIEISAGDKRTKKSNTSEEKTEKNRKPKEKKEACKRYIQSDEEYDDEEEQQRRKAVKRAKKVKEVAAITEMDSDSEERKEAEVRIVQILNNGDKKALLKLNGVGDKRAEKIIEYRNENPVFTKLSELRRAGFTDKLIVNIVNTQLD